MGFKVVGFLAVVLLCGGKAAQAQNTGAPEITVMVFNAVRVPEAEIRAAEVEAGRIFRAAGIESRWIECFRVHTCHHSPGVNEYVLSIVTDGKTSNDLVFGLAFLGPDGRGKYSDVFFRPIQAAYGGGAGNISRLLGTVAAHELGHLLLGSHAHTNDGIMSAVWKKRTLQQLEMGQLLFNREQAALMKNRIAGEAMLLAGATSGTK